MTSKDKLTLSLGTPFKQGVKLRSDAFLPWNHVCLGRGISPIV